MTVGSCALAALGAILPWVLAVAGHELPRRGVQGVVGVSLAVLAGLALRWAGRALAGEMSVSRWAGGGLVALAGLAVAVHCAGLSFEIGQGYYLDEGIYRAAAERIDNGAPLPHNFIYGHLSYYLVAWSLWLHRLFLGPTNALAAWLAGLTEEEQVNWLWIRSWSAVCGVLTTLAVFGIARRIVRGAAAEISPRAQAAGFLGAGLITVATLYNEVTHIYISDVPAAFFATACLYLVARLAGRESWRDYVLAGAAAGLAAACKYPAGVVVVAIAVVWLGWRWRERRWNYGLLLAAAASLGTFLLVMPAFFVHLGEAFAGQGRDVFFGFRQYAGSGWIGVEKDSNAIWYGAQVLATFGPGALLLGIAGVAWLERAERRRYVVLAIFPLVYGALICSMSMVVKRNLQPLLPIAAALLGVGGAALAERLARAWPRRRLALQGAVALAVLAEPTVAVVQQDLSLTRPGTREVIADWIKTHVPPGAGLLKEAYTPYLEPSVYDVVQRRFAVRVEPAQLWSGRFDFVLLADAAYGRFLKPANLRKAHQEVFAQRYRRLLALPEVQKVEPGSTRLGPGFTLRRLELPEVTYRRTRDFSAAEAAFLSDPGMGTHPGALEFRAPGQTALFKEYLEAGRYEARVEGDAVAGGTLRAVTLENRRLGEVPLGAAEAQFTVPARQKVFLYVQLPPGSRLRALHLQGPDPGRDSTSP